MTVLDAAPSRVFVVFFFFFLFSFFFFQFFFDSALNWSPYLVLGLVHAVPRGWHDPLKTWPFPMAPFFFCIVFFFSFEVPFFVDPPSLMPFFFTTRVTPQTLPVFKSSSPIGFPFFA